MSEKTETGATNEAKAHTEGQPQEVFEELVPPIPKPESRARRFFRLAIRWVVGLLIVFLLGVLTATLLFYRPTLARLTQLQAEYEQATQRVAELEAEVARLSTLEQRNRALEEELANANLRLKVLRVLADVHAARWALSQEDATGAQQILAQSSEALKEIAKLAGATHREDITAMQNRLGLALDELGRDAFAAQSDLGVLASNLAQLEQSLASSP